MVFIITISVLLKRKVKTRLFFLAEQGSTSVPNVMGPSWSFLGAPDSSGEDQQGH